MNDDSETVQLRPRFIQAINSIRTRSIILAICAAPAVTDCALSQQALPGANLNLDNARINTTVFECPASNARSPFEFSIRRGPGEIALWLPFDFDRPYLVLSQDFREVEDTFWEGDVMLKLVETHAELAVGTEQFSVCTANPVRSVWEHAKLTGVDFRATGTNPDWLLELRNGGNLLFQTIPADLRVTVPTPEPETNRQLGSTLYRTQIDGQLFVVALGGGACITADGAATAGTSVAIKWEGREFSGCGRALH